MLKEGQVFKLKKKIGTLAEDIKWMILGFVKPKNNKAYYKVMLESSKNYRPIAIITQDEINKAIENNIIEFLKIKKIKLK